MSHKATNWLSDIPADRLSASEFRVLFHLCDCHNPSQGCFPTQGYLIEKTGASNGTVNNALNGLEEKGLIKRHQSRDGVTKRQKPTHYILGFEMGEAQEPTPKTGDGKGPKPSPNSGVGAVSKKRGEPSPKKGGGPSPAHWRVTCKEPVNNQTPAETAAEKPMFFTSDEVNEALQVARHIRQGGTVNAKAIPLRVRTCIVARDLLDSAERSAAGIC